MAEIRIEKKAPIWPWILLGLLILALLAWWILDDDNDNLEEIEAVEDEEYGNIEDDEETRYIGDVDGDMDYPTEVAGFIKHVNDDAEGEMGLDHEYTAAGIMELAEAIRYLSNKYNVNVSVEEQTLQQKAKQIQQDPASTNHANIIAEVFDNTASALTKIAKKADRDVDDMTEDLNQMAEDINPKELTLDQKDDVKSFFDKAADIIEELA